MTVDTTEQRTRARNMEAMGLPGTAQALTDSADEIDTLRRALAAVPHAELCRLLMTRDGEPCSCEKSAIATSPASPLLSDETSVTYLGVTRLNVFGPGGRVVGLLGVTGVHVELVENGRALQVVFEQEGANRA
ncbi:hypothetical protein DEJ30_12035 [Curtobacterium sp. MCPF17_003]|uniref:hypothetical protein n=1 Tax=Curtobacterium sp. MCPF17_003 TaxID=2175637 RepID=UPI000D91F19D|nr:hypothetical protein [Curtobacterium sp. MCPF17_003]PYY63636.1 hypothetical protein DEJ30_12035 [Curtobacterium sp. MCPF17_003]